MYASFTNFKSAAVATVSAGLIMKSWPNYSMVGYCNRQKVVAPT